MGILDALKGRPKQPLIKVTSISLGWSGTTHSLPGIDSEGSVFEAKIPFSNKVEGIMEVLKAQSSAPVVISGFESSQPFRILSVSPKLPANVEANTTQVFTLKIEGPAYKFEGPLQLKMLSDTSGFVQIGVPKIIVHTRKGTTTLDEPARTMSVPKGNVFTFHLQMYRVLSYTDKVESVGVSEPFELVETTPMAPFSLEVKDSYVLELKIRAPDFSYSGNLEINFK